MMTVKIPSIWSALPKAPTKVIDDHSLLKARKWVFKVTPLEEEASKLVKQGNVESSPSVPILRYIPKSRRNEGQSPFVECPKSK